MNKRERLLNLIDGAAPSSYIPAAFFMHFDPDHHQGQPAIDKHLEFFHATGMDLLKIQYEQILPPSIPITKPEDWANIPPCTEEFFEPTLHIVRELVRAAKAEAPVIMTLYSPFMWFKYLAEAEVVRAHFRENPDAMKKGLEIFTEYVLMLVRLCKAAGVDGFYASTQGGEAFRFKGTTIFQDFIKPADLAVWAEIEDAPVNILHVCDYNAPYADLSPFVDYPGHVVNCNPQLTESTLSWAGIARMFGRPCMGGLDRHGLIASAGPAEIGREVVHVLDDASRPFMLGADCTLPSDIKWDNIRAAIDAAHAYKV